MIVYREKVKHQWLKLVLFTIIILKIYTFLAALEKDYEEVGVESSSIEGGDEEDADEY